MVERARRRGSWWSPARAALVALAVAGPVVASGQVRPVGPEDLTQRVWEGVQRAQRHETIEGDLIETRTSPLLARPMVLRGTFAVQGTSAFLVEYTTPHRMKIVYQRGYVNVTTGRQTDAFESGSGVARALSYLGKPDSLDNFRRDFATTAEEVGGAYVLRMEPVAGRFKSRTGPIVATFRADDFAITRLEINGRSGVKSVFDIRIRRMDARLDPKIFDLYRPDRGKSPCP